MQKTIAIDFDGVLHAYSDGWRDGSIYDVVVPRAVDAVTKLQDAGYHIVVFSTRADTPAGKADMVRWLGEQCFRVAEMEVTDRKVPAIAYIDDRGVRFTNWPDIVKLWT